MNAFAAALLLMQPMNWVADPAFERIGTQWLGVEMEISRTAEGSLTATSDGRGPNPWSQGLHGRIEAAIPAGQTAVLRAQIRADRPMAAGLHIERNSDPYDKLLSAAVQAGPEWQEILVVGSTGEGLPANGSQVAVHLGTQPGRFEMRAISLEVMANPPAGLRTRYRIGIQPAPAAWQREAQSRIEKHRKADLKVKVIDAEGRPVSGARIKTEQLRHAFRFGTAVSPDFLLGEEPDNRRYRAELSRLFNTAVMENDFKWTDYARPELAQVALDQLEQMGLEHRGHVLVWGGWRNLPSGFDQLPVPELRERMLERVRTAVASTKGRLYAWDVVNEPNDNWDAFERAGEELFIDVFRTAGAVDPNLRLVLNDYNLSQADTHTSRLIELTKRLQEEGAPVHAIGDQAHMGAPFFSMSRVWEIWDRIHRETGLPIEITEFDAVIPDDGEHAVYVRDFLTAAFAHPAIDTFMIWGWWEGNQWRGPDAALARLDWSSRPALEAYEDLVLNQWWSREAGQSGRAGDWRTRLFKGRHRVTVERYGRTASAVVEVGSGLEEIVIRLN